MAFENDTNAGRVQKMIETFNLIRKSALSNRVDDHAMQSMMRPLAEALTGAGVLAIEKASVADTAAPTSVLTAGQRAALHLADRASMRDLIAALLGRLEAHDARLSASDGLIDRRA